MTPPSERDPLVDELLKIVYNWRTVYIGIPWRKAEVSVQGLEGAELEWAQRAADRLRAALSGERGEERYTPDEILRALYDAERDYGASLVGSLSDMLLRRLRAPTEREEG